MKVFILISSFLSLLIISGCGKKAALYPVTEDRSATQSDQAFVFPPQRANNNSTDKTPKPQQEN